MITIDYNVCILQSYIIQLISTIHFGGLIIFNDTFSIVRNWGIIGIQPNITQPPISVSDPHPETLFWHSFWHAIWKYCIYIYMAYIYSDILSGVDFDILSDILLSGIHSDMLSGIYSDIRSGVWLRSGSGHWDLEPTEIRSSQLRSEAAGGLIKSKDPHIADGEKDTVIGIHPKNI